MHCTLDFCPDKQARKESNLPKLKSRQGLTGLIYTVPARVDSASKINVAVSGADRVRV